MESGISWMKLERRDSWGHVRFVADNKTWLPKLKEGGSTYAFVRFPDQVVVAVEVRVEKRRTTISDHGHPYVADSLVPVAVMDYHGKELRFDFDGLEVDRDAWEEQ